MGRLLVLPFRANRDRLFSPSPIVNPQDSALQESVYAVIAARSD
jgi:hypothetical protein